MNNGGMETVKNILKGIWEFCGYVFVPQRRPKFVESEISPTKNSREMKNFEITKEGIVIIQWLNSGDPQLGEDLYNKIKHKEGEHDHYFVEYHKVDTKDAFVAVLKDLISKTKEGTLFTLHIVAHGDENSLGIDDTNEIRWAELFHYTRQLNEIMGNNLLLVLSSCVGGGILSYIEPEKRAPYRAVIANTREVAMKDANAGFAAFYEGYFNMLDFPEAIKALNGEIDFSKEIKPGRKKTEFFIMSAEESFDAVFNPDRDPVHFESVINKLMPPNPLIPQELRIEKAKKLFRKRGEALRPYFTFQD